MYALILQVQAKISTEWPMFPGYDYDKTSHCVIYKIHKNSRFSDYDSNPTGTGGSRRHSEKENMSNVCLKLVFRPTACAMM